MLRIFVFSLLSLLLIQDKPTQNWTSNYRLQWQDFKANPKLNTTTVAVTASGLSFGFSTTTSSRGHIEDFNFTKSTVQVSEIVSEADILYLNIESDASVLLLDFKDAQDYRVLFLNDNYWTVGSTFALNNENGFVIQTRYKKILLMRYAFHLKRIEPKVYVHPPSSNVKINIFLRIFSR